jgi:purine nucleosidase
VTLGPLTNLALAVRLDPALPSLVESVVVMGGACQAVGNANMAAEFNIHADPEAAAVVLGAFPSITLVTWELTMRCGLDDAFMERWMGGAEKMKEEEEKGGSSGGSGGGGRRAFLSAISRHLVEKTKAEGEEYASLGFLIPDPLAMCVALRPDEVVRRLSAGGKRRRVYVELAGAYTRGMTVVDWDGRGPGEAGVGEGGDVRSPNVEIVESVDMEAVKGLLLRSVEE